MRSLQKSRNPDEPVNEESHGSVEIMSREETQRGEVVGKSHNSASCCGQATNIEWITFKTYLQSGIS